MSNTFTNNLEKRTFTGLSKDRVDNVPSATASSRFMGNSASYNRLTGHAKKSDRETIQTKMSNVKEARESMDRRKRPVSAKNPQFVRNNLVLNQAGSDPQMMGNDIINI